MAALTTKPARRRAAPGPKRAAKRDTKGRPARAAKATKAGKAAGGAAAAKVGNKAAGSRPLWGGAISFGLVNIPVRLYSAVREQRVAFHLLHDQDGARLRRKLVCPADGREVHPEHVLRGYEVAKDQFVVVRDEELEACAPDKTRTIAITDFVRQDEIDPVYLERPYYVLPQPGAARAYRLLHEAMTRAGRVAVGRIVFHEKEYLAAVRPAGDLLCLQTMHFHDEIVPPESVDPAFAEPADAKQADVKKARSAIESMTEPFRPDRYRDTYRDCVLAAVKKKESARQIVAAPADEADEAAAPPAAARSGDLMSTIEASVAAARQHAEKRRKSA